MRVPGRRVEENALACSLHIDAILLWQRGFQFEQGALQAIVVGEKAVVARHIRAQHERDGLFGREDGRLEVVVVGQVVAAAGAVIHRDRDVRQ